LIALVPALVLGTHDYNIYGASLAELGVAMLVVLPCYLVELRKTGISLRVLGRHLLLPIAGAVLTGLAAIGIAGIATSDFVIVVANGATTALIVGVLVYCMRKALAALRSSSVKADAAPYTDVDACGDASEKCSSIRELVCTEEDPDDNGTSKLSIFRDAEPSGRTDHYALRSRPDSGDRRSYVRSPQAFDAPPPLYLRTVASFRWDPETTFHSGHFLGSDGNPDYTSSAIRPLPRALAVLASSASNVDESSSVDDATIAQGFRKSRSHEI